ncbi:Uncharacterized protein HZ326_26540 [Fusarium oxysporum f. sp. albedinis]|nr:Uncharacterized protein HZ326_26540 [Fusarium oxysporum f. sp. albedinis]
MRSQHSEAINWLSECGMCRSTSPLPVNRQSLGVTLFRGRDGFEWLCVTNSHGGALKNSYTNHAKGPATQVLKDSNQQSPLSKQNSMAILCSTSMLSASLPSKKLIVESWPVFSPLHRFMKPITTTQKPQIGGGTIPKTIEDPLLSNLIYPSDLSNPPDKECTCRLAKPNPKPPRAPRPG